MEALCLTDALKLYTILKPYLPARIDGTVMEIAQAIIDGMESDPMAYLEALCLMSGKGIEDFQKVDPLDALSQFVEGLMVNRLELLVKFCRDSLRMV